MLLPLLALAVHATVVEPYDLRLTRVDVPVADLPSALDGYTIAVLSDLHCGPAAPPAYVARAIALARSTSPDLVALVGDYAVSIRRTPRLNERWYGAAMRALDAPLRSLCPPDGVLAVLGNHDHYFDADAVARWLGALGARVLVNDSVAVRRGDATLVIGGVDDAREGYVDPDGGCAGQPADAPTIVLAHNPDAVLALGAGRRIDLVVSGHTHGGQVVLPVIGAISTHALVCTRHAASGWVPNDRAPLFVSRGVGVQHPPRIGCPPEVVVLKLRAVGSV
ncbi:MAG: metallophosphoesterase [Gemmatimonadaceae bacterium]